VGTATETYVTHGKNTRVFLLKKLLKNATRGCFVGTLAQL